MKEGENVKIDVIEVKELHDLKENLESVGISFDDFFKYELLRKLDMLNDKLDCLK